jgi:hypothetical protein
VDHAEGVDKEASATLRNRDALISMDAARRADSTHVQVDREVAAVADILGKVPKRVRLPGSAPTINDLVVVRPYEREERADVDEGID